MKLRRLLAILLAFSTLCFLSSCGDDNSFVLEATETTQEYTYKSFGDIGFDIKSSWSCETKPNYLKVTDPDDNSCFEVYSKEIDPALGMTKEIEEVYLDLLDSKDCTDKSPRKGLKSCDINTCTFKVKETNCNMVMYWFGYKDTLYAIYIQKDGKINEYADTIMNQSIVLMKLQENIKEELAETPNSDYPHP